MILPLFLFSATFYPLETYPEALQCVVQITPLYQGVDLIRSLTVGAITPGPAGARRVPDRHGDDRVAGRLASAGPPAAQVAWDGLGGACGPDRRDRRVPSLPAAGRVAGAGRPRAVARFRDETYWGRPVPGFGDPDARILLVGLAPAAHGGNRTGRVFTGDASGDFLFARLHAAGLATSPTSRRADDGLRLSGTYIAAAVRMRPTGEQAHERRARRLCAVPRSRARAPA